MAWASPGGGRCGWWPEGEERSTKEQDETSDELPRRVHACKCVHGAYEEGKRAKRAVWIDRTNGRQAER